jgi:hypothetical protein
MYIYVDRRKQNSKRGAINKAKHEKVFCRRFLFSDHTHTSHARTDDTLHHSLIRTIEFIRSHIHFTPRANKGFCFPISEKQKNRSQGKKNSVLN